MSLLTIPHTGVSSNPITAAGYNANFNAISTVINGNIDSTNIASNGVVTANITDLAVTTAKLASEAVTTAKIDDGAVTLIKLAASSIAGRPGATYNLGFTSTGGDTLVIKSADGSSFSSTNVGLVCVPGATAGTFTTFSITADITMDIDNCHWGLDGAGNLADVELRVYAINDAGTLRWGISNKGGYRSITTALSSATATDINLQTEMLVTATLSGTSACAEVGYFLADYTDTGDDWAIQTGVGELNVGIQVRDRTDWTSFTPTGSFVANTTYAGQWRRVGDTAEYDIAFSIASGPPTSTTLTINLPTGHKIATGKTTGAATEAYYGSGIILEGGSQQFAAIVHYASVSSVGISAINVGSTYGIVTDVTELIPMTWGNTDALRIRFSVPILGWSAN